MFTENWKVNKQEDSHDLNWIKHLQKRHVHRVYLSFFIKKMRMNVCVRADLVCWQGTRATGSPSYTVQRATKIKIN